LHKFTGNGAMTGKSFIKDYSPLLLKYKEGEDVTDQDDIPKLEMLASVGLIKKGISTKRRQITAKTTSMGLGLLSD
jgi:hypothetical protein